MNRTNITIDRVTGDTLFIPTVTMDAGCRFPSSWREAIGTPLTNAAIQRHMRNGWYGRERQLIAIGQLEQQTGIVHRCVTCDQIAGKHYKYAYLTKPGFYCPSCIAVIRAQHVKSSNLEAELSARFVKARNAEYA